MILVGKSDTATMLNIRAHVGGKLPFGPFFAPVHPALTHFEANRMKPNCYIRNILSCGSETGSTARAVPRHGSFGPSTGGPDLQRSIKTTLYAQ